MISDNSLLFTGKKIGNYF